MRQLGAACAGLELKAEARAWYRLAIGANPLDSEAQRALYRLTDPEEGGHQPPAPTPPGSPAGARPIDPKLPDRPETSLERSVQ